MSKFYQIHNSFASGELSDRLAGRTDLAKYFNSCRTMTNMLPTATGIAISRPGTKYITNSISNSYVSRLIPFEATTDAYYLLEFSNSYFRIIANDAVVLHTKQPTNPNFATDISSWTERNTGTGDCTWDAGNARMSMTGTASNNARAYQAFDDFTVSQVTVTVSVYGSGTLTWRVGTTIGGSEIGTGTLSVGVGQTFNFTNTTVDQRIYLEFDSVSTLAIDTISFSQPEYRIDHPYTAAELQDIKFAQYNDLLYIVHPSHRPRILQRLSSTLWRFTPWDFPTNTNVTLDYSEGPWLDTNETTTTLTASAVSGSITLTASAATFSSTDVGRLVRYKGTVSDEDDYTYTGTAAQIYFKIPFFPSATSTDVDVNWYGSNGGALTLTYTAGAPGANQWTIATSNGFNFVWADEFGGIPLPVSDQIVVRRKFSGSGKWGYAKITAFTSSTSVTATVLSDFSGLKPTTDWQLGAFSATTGYPSSVGFHDQRLWFASTTNQPQTIWGSETGHFGSFSPDSDLLETITDSSSITLTMSSSRVAKVSWLISRGDLIIGTTAGVYSIKPSSAVGISPLSPPILKLESATPCSSSPAITSESAALFIDGSKTKVYDAAYNLQADSYLASELSLLAEHIGESPITRLVFQNIPHPIYWMFRADGKLISLLYMKAQDVIGWAIHEVGGTDVKVIDIQSLKESNSTAIYMIVERTVNGSTVRYLEKLQPEFRYQDKKEAFFVDSGLTLDQTQTTLSLTLSAATVGTGKTFTASGSVFVSGDVGRFIKNTTGDGYAEITGYTSATIVTCTITTAFPSTSVAASSWGISALTVSGLSHLEGQTVSLWADGATLPTEVVSSGVITLATPIFYANVGLGYNRTLKSNRLDFPVKLGSIQGSIGRIHQLVVRLFESSGLQAGTSDVSVVNVPFENTVTISFRDTTTVLNGGDTLFTGDKTIILPSDYSKDVHYLLKSTTAAPLTVVSAVAKCLIGTD